MYPAISLAKLSQKLLTPLVMLDPLSTHTNTASKVTTGTLFLPSTNSVTLRTAYRTGSAAHTHTGTLLGEDSWLARQVRYRPTDPRLTQKSRNTIKGKAQHQKPLCRSSGLSPHPRHVSSTGQSGTRYPPGRKLQPLLPPLHQCHHCQSGSIANAIFTLSAAATVYIIISDTNIRSRHAALFTT